MPPPLYTLIILSTTIRFVKQGEIFMTMTNIQIKALEDALDYNKDTLPTKYTLVKTQIEEAQKAITKENNPRPELQKIYYKLTLYALIIQRNKAETLKYLAHYQANFSEEQKKSFAYAETLNLLGHAETITGTFKEPTLFKQALQILDQLDSQNDEEKVAIARTLNLSGHAETITSTFKEPTLFKPALQMVDQLKAQNDEEKAAIARERAFAIRYIGLCHHRAYMAEKKPDDLAQARELFTRSLEIYNQYSTPNQPCMQKAESIHLLATTWREAGNIEKAHEIFIKAYKEEKAFVKQHGKHFLLYITCQNLGDIKKRLALAAQTTDPEKSGQLFEKAIKLLTLAEKGQRALFDNENDDLAKTLQFLGDILLASKKHYQLATEKLIAALNLKWKLLEDKNSRLIQFAHESLIALLKDLSSKNEDHPLIDECLKHFSNIQTGRLSEPVKILLNQLQLNVAKDYRHRLKNEALALYFEGQAFRTENNSRGALKKFNEASGIASMDNKKMIEEAYRSTSTQISAPALKNMSISASPNTNMPTAPNPAKQHKRRSWLGI